MSGRRLVYLHGFASSSLSSKAAYLAERAREAGLECLAPDLNEPAFATLTVTRMIDRTEALIGAGRGPVTLIGSSLGGLVAIFAAARQGERGGGVVDTLVLMAPAIDLVPGLTAHFGAERLQEWERTNRLDVFHHADQRMQVLEWEFFADARRYDPWSVDPRVPTLVFQGSRDETVDPLAVQRWCAGRPNVSLRLVDDGHQLKESLDVMWADMRSFLAAADADVSGRERRT